MSELKANIARYLLLADPLALDIVLGVAKAQDLPGNPPWLMLVGPPSGTKTELVSMLESHCDAFPLSDLTERTFASGMTVGPGDDDPSLLNRLTNQILLLKDFTTVLSMHSDKQQAILAQLREIYDGKYDKVWGTGKQLHWRGRLGFVAGVTEVIDSRHSVMGILGPRFVLLRVKQPDRRRLATRAMRNARSGDAGLSQLRDQVAMFLHTLPGTPPAISESDYDRLSEIADFVTRARSAVERGGRSRELNFAPEPEMPARFARALLSLVQGVAIVREHTHVEQSDLAAAVRVGLDSIPAVRRHLLEQLADGSTMAETTLTGSCVHKWSASAIRRGLEDLQALGLAQRIHITHDKAVKSWCLRAEWRAFCASISETSGGPIGRSAVGSDS